MKCGGTRYIRLRTQGFSIWGTRELPKSLSISIAWHHKKIRIVRNFGGSQILKMKCGGTRIDKIRNPCFTAHFSPTLQTQIIQNLIFFSFSDFEQTFTKTKRASNVVRRIWKVFSDQITQDQAKLKRLMEHWREGSCYQLEKNDKWIEKLSYKIKASVLMNVLQELCDKTQNDE